MVYPLIIRAVGTYLLKKGSKKALKKDLAQAKRKPQKKLKNTENFANVDRFTKTGKNKVEKTFKVPGESPKKIQSPYSGLTSKTKKQQAPNVLGPAGSYKSPTKRFNQKDIEMAVSNAMKKAKKLKGIK